jgi:anaerobic selenocysteine-containing dehydrogenase
VSIDTRLTTTGLYSDYVLPAAQHYEKLGNSMPSIHHLNFVLCDRAAPPAGESLPDWEIGVRLLEKIEERARARGLEGFRDAKGVPRSFQGLVAQRPTLGGALRDEERHLDESVRDNAVYGVLPKGTTLDTLRRRGFVRFAGWGMAGHGVAQGSTLRPDEVHSPLRWHTEEKIPYDTLVRRAQFLDPRGPGHPSDVVDDRQHPRPGAGTRYGAAAGPCTVSRYSRAPSTAPRVASTAATSRAPWPNGWAPQTERPPRRRGSRTVCRSAARGSGLPWRPSRPPRSGGGRRSAAAAGPGARPGVPWQEAQ